MPLPAVSSNFLPELVLLKVSSNNLNFIFYFISINIFSIIYLMKGTFLRQMLSKLFFDIFVHSHRNSQADRWIGYESWGQWVTQNFYLFIYLLNRELKEGPEFVTRVNLFLLCHGLTAIFRYLNPWGLTHLSIFVTVRRYSTKCTLTLHRISLVESSNYSRFLSSFAYLSPKSAENPPLLCLQGEMCKRMVNYTVSNGNKRYVCLLLI